MITKYNNGGEIAKTILKQLGGAGKLVAMTGAYNFVDMGKGLAFKIKNAKSNYIKITLTSLDLYNVEIGRIRGTTYKVVAEAQNLYADQLVPFIEKTTGMYLSLFARGGDVFNTLSSIMKSEDEEATDFIVWEDDFIDELKGVLKVDRGYAEEVAENNQMVIMDYYYKGFSPQDAAFLLMYGDNKNFAYGGELYDRYEEALDNFNPMNLDAYETMMYKNLTERGMDKVDALKIIINNVEGDYSQLSPSLADIAEVEFVEERMAKGGMTTFQDKVDAISKRLEGTKVPKRLEKDYGKRYNKEEAIQAGRRIAGSIVAKENKN
jgi:hypothetical protein